MQKPTALQAFHLLGIRLGFIIVAVPNVVAAKYDATITSRAPTASRLGANASFPRPGAPR